jgi:hypothetical protein
MMSIERYTNNGSGHKGNAETHRPRLPALDKLRYRVMIAALAISSQACSFFADPIPGYNAPDINEDASDARPEDEIDATQDLDAADIPSDTAPEQDLYNDVTDMDLIGDVDTGGQDTTIDTEDEMTDATDAPSDPEQDSDNDVADMDTGESCISCDQEVQSNNICNEAMTAFTSCQQTEGDIYCRLVTTLCENDCIQPRDGSDAYCGTKCEPESARYCLPDTFGCLSNTIMITCGDDSCKNNYPCNFGEFCRDGFGCVTD